MQPTHDKHPARTQLFSTDIQVPLFRKVIRVFESCSEMQRRVNRFHDV
ncbi:hypothetical protein ACFORG_17170 [Lutimaribacter marinistellae]|uniref:Uncharacterized protein n=1 Tax=Lutimaribacter marinistellae TaxID=1820329 RepID=A0ABV7TNR9_9RHOB